MVTQAAWDRWEWLVDRTLADAAGWERAIRAALPRRAVDADIAALGWLKFLRSLTDQEFDLVCQEMHLS